MLPLEHLVHKLETINDAHNDGSDPPHVVLEHLHKPNIRVQPCLCLAVTYRQLELGIFVHVPLLAKLDDFGVGSHLERGQ